MSSHILSIEASLRSLAAEQERLRKKREAARREIEENRDMTRSMMTMNETLVKNQKRSVQPPNPTATTVSGVVAAEHTLSPEELRNLLQESSGSGNFAAHLTSRLYPELFGMSQLKHEFNWHCGATATRSRYPPPRPQRKEAIRHYVGVFYPEALVETVSCDSLIPKVNELLRRQGTAFMYLLNI
ncbi:hypothetical protein DPMN_057338 [Dreissena polymorpha]|uniref:Uncharacterized protein n=1 Tax=Dreissena polymorpha TaxID=45954 RepID=A0A9D4HE50_DREPO|nr:hypothetical protein DPMN_057338 [Dreissena polymorpha]